MSQDKHEKTKNMVEEIERLTNCYTRTERHLEQHSDIASEERIKDAKELQKERMGLINKLEDKIAYGGNHNQNELKNLKENYESTEGYINNNSEHMNKSDLNNLKEKQENRENQINWLE